MATFRNPVYLDQDILPPLANHHGIEVLVDVAVTQRDAGSRKGGLSFGASVPAGPVQVNAGANLEKGGESELTQTRTIKDHPTGALNRLLDALEASNELTYDLSDTYLRRDVLVEIDGEWEISPVTEAGAMMTRLMQYMQENPSVAGGGDVPMDAIMMLANPEHTGTIVLRRDAEEPGQPAVLVLMDSDHLLLNTSLDDLEDEGRVFGQVDRILAEGQTYSLNRYFMSGFNRALRRAFDAEDMLKSMAQLREGSSDDLSLTLTGPLIVVRGIAFY